MVPSLPFCTFSPSDRFWLCYFVCCSKCYKMIYYISHLLFFVTLLQQQFKKLSRRKLLSSSVPTYGRSSTTLSRYERTGNNHLQWPNERIHWHFVLLWQCLHSDDGFFAINGCKAVTTPTLFMEFWQCAHSISVGATAISKIEYNFFSSPIGLKFCICLEGENTQNCTDLEFWISSPKKFGAPLNFVFALRTMGWKISNWLCFTPMAGSHRAKGGSKNEGNLGIVKNQSGGPVGRWNINWLVPNVYIGWRVALY